MSSREFLLFVMNNGIFSAQDVPFAIFETKVERSVMKLPGFPILISLERRGDCASRRNGDEPIWV